MLDVAAQIHESCRFTMKDAEGITAKSIELNWIEEKNKDCKDLIKTITNSRKQSMA